MKRFSEGRDSVTDEEISGWPATSRTEENITKIRQIFCENCWLTVRIIAEQVNIDRDTDRKILTEEQKQRRVAICQDLLERRDYILGCVITGDETWVYQYDPETKRQSAQWKTANSPLPKNFRWSKSRVKTMLLTLYIRGMVHYEFVPTGQTVNEVCYLEVLEMLCENVRRKRPELFVNKTHGSCITTMHLLTRHCL